MSGAGPVLVLGAGAWGTALAVLLAGNGVRTLLWGRSALRQERMCEQRENPRYLPGVAFPAALEPIVELDAAASGISHAVLAVPCQALRSVLLRWKVLAGMHLCITCKGIERGTFRFAHQVVAECLEAASCSILSGPSFATEVSRNQPTAVTIAAERAEPAETFARWFSRPSFRVRVHRDLVGTETCGAVKNVVAIAAGVSDGLELGSNARAVLMTQGLSEMTRFGMSMGARPETFVGLAGLGDLLLTCTSRQSRNYLLGQLLAEGSTLQEAQQRLNSTLEGAHSAYALHHLAAERGIAMPIVRQVLALLNGEVRPEQGVHRLLQDDPQLEFGSKSGDGH